MSVISEINIICIEQKDKSNYRDECISVEARKNPCNFYGNEWKILSSFRGTWYQITPKNRKFGIYNDEFFDLHDCNVRCYVSFSKINIDIDFIKKLLNFYLIESPIHKICFLIRLHYQGKTKISGVIKLNEFINKFENKKILFDTAYIIEI